VNVSVKCVRMMEYTTFSNYYNTRYVQKFYWIHFIWVWMEPPITSYGSKRTCLLPSNLLCEQAVIRLERKEWIALYIFLFMILLCPLMFH